jgi:hypothetical protein
MAALRIFLLVSIIACLPATTRGQELSLLREIKIKQPVSISTDRYSHIFTSDLQGNVHKFDSTGKLLHIFSPEKVARASLIEAWPTIQVFLFYRDLQAYTFLNRFLTVNRQSASFNTATIGFARVATVSSDEQIWVFDEVGFSMKKLNPLTQQLSLNVPLGLILASSDFNINYMREYQNMLFVNDANSGILVFDNFGNYKKKLPFSGLSYFGFHGNELYYVNKSGIHFFNLYTLASRSIPLPVKQKIEFALVFHTQLVLFSGNSIYIYRLNFN